MQQTELENGEGNTRFGQYQGGRFRLVDGCIFTADAHCSVIRVARALPHLGVEENTSVDLLSPTVEVKWKKDDAVLEPIVTHKKLIDMIIVELFVMSLSLSKLVQSRLKRGAMRGPSDFLSANYLLLHC